MKIKREKLLKNLQDFVSQGNGVIIGSPGVGKTYLLRELRQNLKSRGMPHLLLPIDKLGEGTDEILRRELSYEGDLIEKLESVPISEKKAVLLFDAFDAARSEETRKNFLRLIRRSIQELKQWNVVVTVRTYDAKKSQELLDLFGDLDNTDLTQYHSNGILCRHFTIPSLNEDEIRQAFDQISSLERIYNAGSPEFKQLVANPFNLWLLEKILNTSKDKPDFSQVRSEVQLLGVFWQRRVEMASNEVHRLSVLTQIVRQMVKEHSLTVRLDNIENDLGFDKPTRETAWNDLLSDEILARVSSTRQRIAFSHNILFDYAISVLLIDDEPEQIEDFVREDPSRPLFLRPSFTYFFTRLWYDASENFWNAFWYVLPSNRYVHLRLFARLIPTSVIANEARNINQLKQFLDKLENGEGIANEAMICLLQSLRALQIEHDPLWSNFFDRVSAHLHINFTWDLTTLTSEMLERAAANQDTAVINACGRVGRQLLAWIWQERETNEDDWNNRLGGHWIVPLVAKTYGTNPKDSRRLLEKVLELTQEDNFPINFLTWLTEHVDRIWPHDPEFVELIYRTIFSYYETSDERTRMGGFIVAMASTRRQDYTMCQYRLIKHFPDFLRAVPLSATRAVIQSLNFFIIRTHVLRYLREGVTFEDLIKKFNFRGEHAYYVEDTSCIWDGQEYTDEPVEMADTLFELIAELATSEDLLLDSLLDIFRENVWVAFFWKRILKTASQFPEVFAPRLFELCIAKPVQMGNDVLYELCAFLEVAAPEFTPEQRIKIEESILGLAVTSEENHEFLEQRRNRLLAQIPPNLLLTDLAKAIRTQIECEDDVPENRPLASFSSWSEAYTDGKWLQEQGIDTTAPETQELQRFFKPLDKFRSDWPIKGPTEEATKSIVPWLQEGYATIKENTRVNKAVVDLLWYKLTACTAILARVAANPESPLFAFCRQVLLDGAKHKQPEPDPEFDAQFDSPGYSPFPRHEAAHGLLRLTARQSDTKILDAIEKLANDPVPSVRMVTAMELFLVYVKTPERFWYIVDNRAMHETNQVVQERLYTSLGRIIARDEEKTIHAMDKMLSYTVSATETLELVESCVDLLMWLAICRENSWALKTIEDTFFKDPIRCANSLKYAVFRVMKDYVVPKNLEVPEGYEKTKRAIAWIGKAIATASDGIEVLCTTPKAHWTEDVKQQLHDIYMVIDEVIMRLYFAVARKKDGTEEPVEEIPDELRHRFYSEVKPLMEGVIDFALDSENGIMFAKTAHYFMELLTSFLTCNPKEVLHLAEGVVRSSEPFGYNLDSLAVEDVVKLVEIVLADHRNEVRDGQGLEDLLNLLDIFAKTGWSDALRLVWRLDEVFR